MNRSWEVQIDGSEHYCCGEAVELHSVARLRARRWGEPPVLVGVLHPAERDWDMVIIEGRVTEIEALVGDGERAGIVRLPGGDALNGFDDADDGLLLSVIDDEPLAAEPDHFMVTVLGTCVADVPPDPGSDAPSPGWW